jgi:hypothetical protein
MTKEMIGSMGINELAFCGVFCLRSCNESISHDLTNREYGLHILSLI